jgi:hypothetical protein
MEQQNDHITKKMKNIKILKSNLNKIKILYYIIDKNPELKIYENFNNNNKKHLKIQEQNHI